MDPRRVGSKVDEGWRQFMLALSWRKERAQQRRMPLAMPGSDVDNGIFALQKDPIDFPWENGFGHGDEAILNGMLAIERDLDRIWTFSSNFEHFNLDDAFPSVEELLSGGCNILAMTRKLPENRPLGWDKAGYLVNSGKFLLVPEDVTFISIDMALAVGLAKAVLPSFSQLDLDERILILCENSFQLGTILNCFYSVSNSTWTRSNGHTFVSYYQEAFPFNEDQNVHSLSQKIYCDSLESTNRLKLSREEFVLLFAILLCDTNAVDLSKKGRELLYAESVRHSQMLLRRCQHNFGPELGARRYADCIHLLADFNRLKGVGDRLFAYLEVIYHRAEKAKFPKAMQFMEKSFE